jgi:hypothetical protein
MKRPARSDGAAFIEFNEREFDAGGGKDFIHEATRNRTKGARTFVDFFVLFRVASWINSSDGGSRILTRTNVNKGASEDERARSEVVLMTRTPGGYL